MIPDSAPKTDTVHLYQHPLSEPDRGGLGRVKCRTAVYADISKLSAMFLHSGDLPCSITSPTLATSIGVGGVETVVATICPLWRKALRDRIRNLP